MSPNMLLALTFLTSLIHISWTSPLAPVPSAHGNLQTLANATVSILLQEFEDPFGAVHITQFATTRESSHLHADLLDRVISQLDGRIVIRLNVVPNETLRRAWVRNVLLVDSYAAFTELSRELSVEMYDFSGRYLVVYSGESVNDWIVLKVFRDLWKLQIINVVLMAVGGGEEGVVKRWTYFPFSTKGCRLVRLKELEEGAELYPVKTASFYGCSFRVGSFENKPFTMLSRRSGGKVVIKGFEGDLLDLLMKKLNFKAVVYVPPNGEQWGYARPSNSTGLMRMIQLEQVDFGISALGISVARNEILKPGLAHHTSRLVIVVPEGRPYTPFEKLFRPFQASIWVMIAGTLIVAFCTIMLIETRERSIREFVYGRGVNAPCLNLTQVFFGMAMQLLPRRNFARTMLFLWLYLCFILRSLYQGAMFQYLQRNSNLPPSRTLAEVDRTEAYYYMVHSAERYFEAFPHRYQRVRHLTTNPNNIIDRLSWMTQHRESPDVLMATIDHMAYYHRQSGEPVNICRETISTFSAAIYYPKKSLLTRQFDRELVQIQAAGLVNYWVRLYGDYDFRSAPLSKGVKVEPRQLSNEHLTMAYEILAMLLGVSCAVFGLELASVRVRRLRWLLERVNQGAGR